MLTSRDADRVATTVSAASDRVGPDGAHRVAGFAADVSVAESVEALAAFAEAKMGGVDLWINNAGSNAYTFAPLHEQTPGQIEEVVRTNSLGTLLATRAATLLMLRQRPAGGHIFNMEGAGSDGGGTRRYAPYGYTKAGMAQLSKSLAVVRALRADRRLGFAKTPPPFLRSSLRICTL